MEGSKRILIYVMCHNDASEVQAIQVAKNLQSYGAKCKVVKLGSTSVFFESQIFEYIHIHKEEEYDYIGVVPYSVNSKLPKDIQNRVYTEFFNAIRNEANQKMDVFPLAKLKCTRKGKHHISFIEGCTLALGINFVRAWHALLKHMGYDETVIFNEHMEGFIINAWIAKKEWMYKYAEFCVKCMEAINGDLPVVSECLMRDSYYESNLTTGDLIKISGKPYYTMHPFFFERLPAFYFWAENARVIFKGVTVIYDDEQ